MASDLDELREMLAKAPARSPWAAYLRRNFDAFHGTVSKGPIDWQDVSTWAVKNGHTAGKPMTAAAAKRAYYRELVRRYGPQRKKAVVAPKAVPRPVQPVRSPSPVRILTDDQVTRDPDQKIFDALNAGREWLPKAAPAARALLPDREPAPQPKADPLDRVRKAAAASRPWETPIQPKRDSAADPSDQLDAGREWLPKKKL
jgi:hypothetical protein